MFVREIEPVRLSQSGLLALCVSLNRPVLDIASLPVGPARAAIALHRSEPGESCLAVALRSIDAGAVEVFSFQGDLQESVRQAMDVGLSFAETMGFLFDEDMIGSASMGGDGLAAIDDAAGVPRERGAARAYALWCELIGEEPCETPEASVPLSKFRTPAHASSSPVSASSSADSSADLGLGDDDLEPEFTEAPDLEDRRADPKQAQLGRIPIVRRRRRDDPPEPAFAARLMASF